MKSPKKVRTIGKNRKQIGKTQPSKGLVEDRCGDDEAIADGDALGDAGRGFLHVDQGPLGPY